MYDSIGSLSLALEPYVPLPSCNGRNPNKLAAGPKSQVSISGRAMVIVLAPLRFTIAIIENPA